MIASVLCTTVHHSCAGPVQDDKTFNVTAGCCAGPVRDDEHFIVWMRTAALPNFRKLWGRIDQDLSANTQVSMQQTNKELLDDDRLLFRGHAACWLLSYLHPCDMQNKPDSFCQGACVEVFMAGAEPLRC